MWRLKSEVHRIKKTSVYNVNHWGESETDNMILIKGMVYCYLPVGTPLDKSSECGFYESNSRSIFDNCAQLVLNDLYWW